MKKDTKQKQQEILRKQSILDNAKSVLKQEFVGIDQVIDDIISAMSAWFLFPDIQQKPVTINLWGMTGVGKTSLVNRLVELINFETKHYQFGTGDKKYGNTRDLQDIYQNKNSIPIIMSFDEFQHARTKNSMGIDIPSSQFIWQLIDSGKFQNFDYGTIAWNRSIDGLNDLIKTLQHLVSKGIKCSNGIVVQYTEQYNSVMNANSPSYRRISNRIVKLENDDDIKFVPSSYRKDIYEVAKEIFQSQYAVKNKLLNMDEIETLSFLDKVIDHAYYPKTVDCSKALIFVMGNLDEAYTMSADFNPDMDADEFHELSLKINITDIKKALKKWFRNEQISRLGNIHIIYPAFNIESFQKIISLQLQKVAKNFEESQGFNLKFDAFIHDIIYREGVYPVQGTRPVFSTIHQIVKSNLAKLMVELLSKGLSVTEILFKAGSNKVIVEYKNERGTIHKLIIPQKFALDDLRKIERDDKQAITAVHEAGHAVIASILLRSIPKFILSSSLDKEKGGMVYTKLPWKYLSRKQIIHRMAHLLGGYVAEKIVFGEENVTIGASGDIRKATNFIVSMLKNCGMGDKPIAYHVQSEKTNNYVFDTEDFISVEAEKKIMQAMTLAETTLRKQESLLIRMSHYLVEHRMMNEDMIKKMVCEYAVDFDANDLIEDGSQLYYRQQLMAKLKNIETIER